MLDEDGGGLVDYRSCHREVVEGSDGEYEIDVTVRFSAMGADYLTLVECKHHRNRVKRELVQALWTKVQSLGAHKGIMFSTAGFQSGAIEFAKAHGIALVHVADGRSFYFAKSLRTEGEMIPWEMVPEFVPKVVCWVIDGGMRSSVAKEPGRRLRDLVPDIGPARVVVS
jgi:restriction system protein